jgi:hypothetical protein
VRELPSEMRPREELRRRGAASVPDEVLLAIVLRSGMRGRNVIELAREVLALAFQKLAAAPEAKELTHEQVVARLRLQSNCCKLIAEQTERIRRESLAWVEQHEVSELFLTRAEYAAQSLLYGLLPPDSPLQAFEPSYRAVAGHRVVPAKPRTATDQERGRLTREKRARERKALQTPDASLLHLLYRRHGSESRWEPGPEPRLDAPKRPATEPPQSPRSPQKQLAGARRGKSYPASSPSSGEL